MLAVGFSPYHFVLVSPLIRLPLKHLAISRTVHSTVTKSLTQYSTSNTPFFFNFSAVSRKKARARARAPALTMPRVRAPFSAPRFLVTHVKPSACVRVAARRPVLRVTMMAAVDLVRSQEQLASRVYARARGSFVWPRGPRSMRSGRAMQLIKCLFPLIIL